MTAGVLLLALGLAPQPEACDPARTRQAAASISCVQPAQLDAVLGYRNPARDQHVMREALAAAAGLAFCLNDPRLFPSNPEPREDFYCLQKQILDFYAERAPTLQDEAERFRYQDLLARASLRFHHSLLDTDATIPEALGLVEEALADYQEVFRAAGQIRAEPRSEQSLELAERLGLEPDSPAPEFRYLEEFARLAVVNARRFPRALGSRLGEALGPALCEAHQLYPGRRTRVAHLNNLLVRFDLGNMAASGQLDLYLERLHDLFRPAAGLPSLLQLEPADWSPTPEPCGEQEWMLVFPSLQRLEGMRLPPPERLQEALEELRGLLVRTAELAENRNHLWKPFQRHAELLSGLAQSLRVGASRDARLRQTRTLLMEAARDTLLMRGVPSVKHPLTPAPLLEGIDRQLEEYGAELLRDLQLESLIEFSEQYLEAGQGFLSEAQQRHLHRLLAIAYSLLEDEAQAVEHLQESDLDRVRLDAIRDELRQYGVGVEVRQ